MEILDKDDVACRKLRERLISQGIIRPDPFHRGDWRPPMSAHVVKSLHDRLVKAGLIVHNHVPVRVIKIETH